MEGIELFLGHRLTQGYKASLAANPDLIKKISNASGQNQHNSMDVNFQNSQYFGDVTFDQKYLEADFFKQLFTDNISLPVGFNKNVV